MSDYIYSLFAKLLLLSIPDELAPGESWPELALEVIPVDWYLYFDPEAQLASLAA